MGRPKKDSCGKGHDLTTEKSRMPDGHCRKCKYARDKIYAYRHTPEYQREWRENNLEKAQNYARKHSLFKKYGLTLEEYAALWNKQNGLCYICSLPEKVKDVTGKPRVFLSVDHDHKTGKVRALLCHHCNAALGHIKDSPELLQRMLEYVTS